MVFEVRSRGKLEAFALDLIPVSVAAEPGFFVATVSRHFVIEAVGCTGFVPMFFACSRTKAVKSREFLQEPGRKRS